MTWLQRRPLRGRPLRGRGLHDDVPGIQRAPGVGGSGAGGPRIVLSATSIDEDAEVGDLIGTLSIVNSPEGVTWAFTLDTGTSSQVELDGSDDTRLEVAEALDHETAPSLTAIVVATPSEGDPISKTFTISVTNLAPLLSDLTVEADTGTTMAGTVVTSEAGGTLYWVVTASATVPSAAQIIAGQDHTGSAAAFADDASVAASGEQDLAATGLSGDTSYYVYVLHQDGAGANSDIADETFDTPPPQWLVFGVFGQSNNFYGDPIDAMTDVGHARLYQYPPRTGGTGTADTVTTAADPLGWEQYGATNDANGKIGYAVAFFRDYYLPANPGHTVVLVPYALGGSALYSGQGWDPDTTPGALLTGAISQVNDAITAAATFFSETVTYGGTLWHQGEGDLHNGRPSMEYRSRLNAVVDYIRSNITGAQSVPFIAGGLSDGTYTTDEIEGTPAWHSTSTGTMWKNFLSTIGTKFLYAGYADSQSPSALAAAAVHFTAAEQRTLAGRYWTAWQAALANDAPACTWDPHDCIQAGSSLFQFSNGNLDISGNGTDGWKTCRATTGRLSGKYYFEIKVQARNDALMMVGLCNAFQRGNIDLANSNDSDNALAYAASVFGTFGQQIKNITSVNAITLASFALNDVFGIAVDLDAGKAWFSQNGTYTNSGDPAAGTDEWISWTPADVGRIWPACSIYSSASNTLRLLPTAASQTYGPPTGFSAWQAT